MRRAHRLAKEGVRTRPIDPEPFLPLSLSKFKSKIRNWIEKRKQNGESVKGMGQLTMAGGTD